MKKVIKILTLIILIITILKISNTYAKYYAAAKATVTQSIGNWEIKVNEIDIYSSTGATKTFNMNDFVNYTNENTLAGKISPGNEGYSSIIIDPTGTQVAIRYDIEYDLSKVSEYEIEAKLEVENKELKRTGENRYTGIITLAEIKAGNKEEIKCYVKWNNNEEKNEIDTEKGTVYGQKFDIPITITLTQYLGEEITEYTE